MLLRNREVRLMLAASALVTVAGAVAATILTGAVNGASGVIAAGTVLLTGAVLTLGWLIATRNRYRALAHLSESLDRVLAGDRSINFREMSEGELAILSSELDKVITRLNLTVDELQDEKLALSDALADISHQLKTPLTSIAISMELIRDRLAEEGASSEILERIRLIQRLQGRVEDLVAALLKLARIDAGVIQLTKSPVMAEALVAKAFEPLAVAFDIANVTFEASIQPEAGFEGDITWSAEALENVLKNCMEHTPAGGRVRVTASEDVLACRIRVEDTGPGIAEADLPHIFERFYRGTTAQTAASSELNPTGVGIGLALAKSLITAQGGQLTAENTGHGAAFTFTFFKAVV